MSWRTARTTPMTSPAATTRPPPLPPPQIPSLLSWKEEPPPPQSLGGRRRGNLHRRRPPRTKSALSSRSRAVKKLKRSSRGKCRLLETKTEPRKVKAAPPPPPLLRLRQTLRRARLEQCDGCFPSSLHILVDCVRGGEVAFLFCKELFIYRLW